MEGQQNNQEFIRNQVQTPSQRWHPVITELLESRNMSLEQIDEFFSEKLKDLPNLTHMQDCQKAAERLIEAVDKKQTIGVYGDYDVDGTTSCALLYHFFQMLSVKINLYQPSRFVEGYGIHPSSIENAIEDKVDVLMTVDCGITNHEAADYAKERGIDLIITDHHTDAAETMIDAYAVVNPNRRDEKEDNPLRVLAGVGVAFGLAVKIREILAKRGQEMPSLYPLLQFVAVGTICDLAKLTPTNLKLVRHGLKQLPNSQYPGLRIFLNQNERKEKRILSDKLAFTIGPMINSKGRLDHPEKALNLLICDDTQKAFEYYSHLEISNNERKLIQSEVYKQASEQVLKQIADEDPIINIVYSPQWHEGVIGIVASKLVETFKVPAIVFSDSGKEVDGEKIIKASARSAGELHLFEALANCNELFEKFGGHKAAAGLSMRESNLPAFKNKIKQNLQSIPAVLRTKQDNFDLKIQYNDISPTLVKQLEDLEPFGMGNPRPIFLLDDIKLVSYDILKDIHVRWTFASKKAQGAPLKGISFNYIGKWGTLSPDEIFKKQNEQQLRVQFTLNINRFNGNEYIQLMVEKLDFPY